MRLFPLATVLVVLASFPLRAEDGFAPLFDGKSLNGWKLVNTEGNFLVKDGVLVMNKGKGWLASEKTYSDFELRIRYRFVTPGADSGIFIRSALSGKNWTDKGYQIQNMDNLTLGMVVGMGQGKVGKKEHKKDVLAKVKKPAGEWMDLTIKAVGPNVSVSLNGEEVASSDSLMLSDGHFGLQAEGGVLEFKSIEVKSLAK